MRALLYWGVSQVARIHNYILGLNDAYEYNFSDKELHFLVIGLLGMAMVFLIYPLFRWLAQRDHEMVITWIYVFTVILVITFAIEIGQKLTNTGTMEFADIMFGVMGFVFMFAVFALLRMVIRWLFHLGRPKGKK
jgi:glycopeptide antibiotics resistance protein